MPDADGKIRGIAVPAEAWERIFGKREPRFKHCAPCDVMHKQYGVRGFPRCAGCFGHLLFPEEPDEQE